MTNNKICRSPYYWLEKQCTYDSRQMEYQDSEAEVPSFRGYPSTRRRINEVSRPGSGVSPEPDLIHATGCKHPSLRNICTHVSSGSVRPLLGRSPIRFRSRYRLSCSTFFVVFLSSYTGYGRFLPHSFNSVFINQSIVSRLWSGHRQINHKWRNSTFLCQGHKRLSRRWGNGV
jgi:hypothetical protein